VHAPNRLAPAFTLFPNPVKDVLTISTDKNVPYLISVTDINGRTLYSKEVFDDLFHVDMSAMHSGLYVVSIITNVSIDTRKIVKF
jgi:hypothetical protein